MLQQSDRQAKLFKVFIGVVARFSDSLCFHFGQLMVQVTKSVDEPRFVIIGRIGAKLWAAVVTYRGEKIRIISVRRARKSEMALYES